MKAPARFALLLLIPLWGTTTHPYCHAEGDSRPRDAAATTQHPTRPTVWSARLKGVVCAMCIQSIRKRIVIHDEVASVDIQLRTGVILVEAKAGRVLDPHLLQDEIVRAGYDLAEILPQL